LTVAGILLASLLGSVHCAAMCGGIAYASGESRLAQAWYHLGRLMVYVTLGAVAGGLGAVVDASGARFGWGRLSTLLAGWALILLGSLALLRILGLAPLQRWNPVERGVQRVVATIRAVPARWRGLALGAATGLLPCGWLYAFVAVAAGTGTMASGASAMAVFWLGTVPWVAAASAALRKLGGRFGARLPAFGALLVIAIGVVTIVGRSGGQHQGSAHLPTAPHGIEHD